MVLQYKYTEFEILPLFCVPDALEQSILDAVTSTPYLSNSFNSSREKYKIHLV